MQQFAVWNGVDRTSIEEPLSEKLFLFPNPAEKELYFNGESPRISKVRIMDIQGRLLMEKMLPPFSGTTSIDISDIPRGLVIVEWTSGEDKALKKIVLE